MRGGKAFVLVVVGDFLSCVITSGLCFFGWTQMEKEITRDLICERESILETTGLLLLEQCVRIAIL